MSVFRCVCVFSSLLAHGDKEKLLAVSVFVCSMDDVFLARGVFHATACDRLLVCVCVASIRWCHPSQIASTHAHMHTHTHRYSRTLEKDCVHAVRAHAEYVRGII